MCSNLLLLLQPTVPLLTCGSLGRSSSRAESVSRTEMWPVVWQGEGKRSPFHRVTLSGGCYGPTWTSTPSASGPVKTTDRQACARTHAHAQLQGPGTPDLKPHAFWDPASFPRNPALEQGSPPPPPALGLSAGTMKEMSPLWYVSNSQIVRKLPRDSHGNYWMLTVPDTKGSSILYPSPFSVVSWFPGEPCSSLALPPTVWPEVPSLGQLCTCSRERQCL